VIRRQRESSEIVNFEQRLFVKVLTSAVELEDALRKASLYERRAVQITGERAARYEALMRPNTRAPARVESGNPSASLENGEVDVGRYEAA
jgi:hypothetical protein